MSQDYLLQILPVKVSKHSHSAAQGSLIHYYLHSALAFLKELKHIDNKAIRNKYLNKLPLPRIIRILVHKKPNHHYTNTHRQYDSKNPEIFL